MIVVTRVACLALMTAGEVAGGDYLRWRAASDHVDADFQEWSLDRVLKQIATASGWTVKVEPGVSASVAARFDHRPTREALALLLPDVSYTLLPATNGSPTLLVFRSISSSATVTVAPDEKAGDQAERSLTKARELIVRLKPGAKLDIRQLAQLLGAKVTGSIDKLGAYRLEFEDDLKVARAEQELAGNEDVQSFEANRPLMPPSQIEGAGTLSIAAPKLTARPLSDGSSVVVALVDTAVGGVTGAQSEFLLPGLSVVGESSSGSAGLTHGPAMFETILHGLATGDPGGNGLPVRVLPIDVYGAQFETSTFDVARAVVLALEKGADIINLSLAGPADSPLLHDVLKQAAAAGVLTVAAAGNLPTTEPSYPAAYAEALAVTAGDRNGRVAPYASRGDFVDVVAPGTSFVAYQGTTYLVNGTSASAAFVSGAAAALAADTGRPMTEVAQQLREKLPFNPRPPAKP